jgi:UPF0042 nucleotide-binding protein
MKLLVVSGRSGSGKSTALHVLEDLGFYCVDNLPITLLPDLAQTLRTRTSGSISRVAVGVDARNVRGDLEQFAEVMREVQAQNIQAEVIFLDARDDVLLARFSATRRKHPLSTRSRPLKEAIELERTLLDPVSARASLRLDTSELNVHELRETLRERLSSEETEGLTVLFESFGFKKGVPLDADIVFDVRCLPNPHWNAELRPHSGLDAPVKSFLDDEPLVEDLYNDISAFLLKWLPHFSENDRSYITVAIGCTGGQHRSVYMVERISEGLRPLVPHVQIRHRDLARQERE